MKEQFFSMDYAIMRYSFESQFLSCSAGPIIDEPLTEMIFFPFKRAGNCSHLNVKLSEIKLKILSYARQIGLE